MLWLPVVRHCLCAVSLDSIIRSVRGHPGTGNVMEGSRRRSRLRSLAARGLWMGILVRCSLRASQRRYNNDRQDPQMVRHLQRVPPGIGRIVAKIEPDYAKELASGRLGKNLNRRVSEQAGTESIRDGPSHQC